MWGWEEEERKRTTTLGVAVTMAGGNRGAKGSEGITGGGECRRARQRALEQKIHPSSRDLLHPLAHRLTYNLPAKHGFNLALSRYRTAWTAFATFAASASSKGSPLVLCIFRHVAFLPYLQANTLWRSSCKSHVSVSGYLHPLVAYEWQTAWKVERGKMGEQKIGKHGKFEKWWEGRTRCYLARRLDV